MFKGSRGGWARVGLALSFMTVTPETQTVAGIPHPHTERGSLLRPRALGYFHIRIEIICVRKGGLRLVSSLYTKVTKS